MERVMETEPVLPAPLPLMSLQVTPFAGYDHACDCVGQLITSGRKAFSVAVNPEKIYQAANDPALAALINRAQMFICDGIGAAVAVRVLYGRAISRITGVGLFYALVERAAKTGWKIYLFGAAPEVNREAHDRLRRDYPGLKVVGRHDGYFDDSASIVADINRSGADILFVALGSPKQERWIADHQGGLDASFCMGVVAPSMWSAAR